LGEGLVIRHGELDSAGLEPRDLDAERRHGALAREARAHPLVIMRIARLEAHARLPCRLAVARRCRCGSLHIAALWASGAPRRPPRARRPLYPPRPESAARQAAAARAREG